MAMLVTLSWPPEAAAISLRFASALSTSGQMTGDAVWMPATVALARRDSMRRRLRVLYPPLSARALANCSCSPFTSALHSESLSSSSLR